MNRDFLKPALSRWVDVLEKELIRKGKVNKTAIKRLYDEMYIFYQGCSTGNDISWSASDIYATFMLYLEQIKNQLFTGDLGLKEMYERKKENE